MQKSCSRSVVPSFSGVLVVVLCLMKVTSGVCPGSPNRSKGYAVIEETNYDRTYSSITSEGKRPLGYEKAVWQFDNADNTPCINITGATSRRLEVMFETLPSSRLCVKVTGNQLECSDTGTGRLFLCLKTTVDTVYVEFTCDSQCSQTDVQFWYRLVLGVTADEDTEDHWCNDRNRDEYPEILQVYPQGLPIIPENTTPSGGTIGVSVNLQLFLFIVCSVACRAALKFS